MIRAAELIERKRDGHELDGGELGELVLAYARGDGSRLGTGASTGVFGW